MPRTISTRRKQIARRSQRSWQLQDAKAQFSELFRRVQSEGPQFVTRQGKDTVVVLAAEEFERLIARARQPGDLVRFFAESPLTEVQLDLERPRDLGRKVRL
jgi:antitoxin Phd